MILFSSSQEASRAAKILLTGRMRPVGHWLHIPEIIDPLEGDILRLEISRGGR